MYRPTGNAISSAMTIDTTEIAMCSAMRTGMPFGPDQFAGSVSQAIVCD